MIDTIELGAGYYPEPNEIIDCEPDDFGIDDEDDDEWYADYYHEQMIIGEIE